MMKYLWGLLLAAGLAGCSSGGRTTKNPQELIGYHITLPENAAWLGPGRDTTITLGDRPKIVVYYNSDGCTSCRLKELPLWKNLLRETQETDSLEVDFVFILKSDPHSDELRLSLNSMRFDHPVLCDPDGEFERNNLLPEDEFFHAFLLDRKNTVILLGVPVFNPALWEKYKEKLAEMI